MEGRLCCLNFNGCNDGDAAYKPQDAEYLQDLFPTGSVLYVYARESTSIQDSYVCWTVVVVSPELLGEERWNELHKSVEELIHLGWNWGEKLEVVGLGQELDALDRWKVNYLEVDRLEVDRWKVNHLEVDRLEMDRWEVDCWEVGRWEADLRKYGIESDGYVTRQTTGSVEKIKEAIRPTDKSSVKGYMIEGFIGGLCGILLMYYLGSGSYTNTI